MYNMDIGQANFHYLQTVLFLSFEIILIYKSQG